MKGVMKGTAFFRLLVAAIVLCTLPAAAIDCPLPCKCVWALDNLEANCSRRGLSSYPSFDNIPVEHLDLSGNQLTVFPRQYADIDSLIYLDLSNNMIASLDGDALIGFTSLQTLLLEHNSIISWSHISPNEAFQYARSLKRLSLSGNHFGRFSNDDASYQLNSQTLSELELSACGISVLGGDQLINHLPNLERLNLSHNKLIQMAALPSKSLRVLDLSNCSVQRFSTHFVEALGSLEVLNLSRNTALQFGSSEDGFITSYTLRELDLSYCNLDEIDLSGLPTLTSLRLRGNMLREVGANSFTNNTLLEQLDFSENVVRHIGINAFAELKRLKILNLAYNEIAQLDRNVIRNNDVLLELNLSRNVLQRLNKIISNSVRVINMSWCEITAIESSALVGLTAIQRLDLSNNLISDVPGNMRSETLQYLDLSNCRLSTVRNSTFREFPELAALHLNGNRLTNPIPTQYFRSNRFLDQLWMGDNPWICDCHNPSFVEFYEFLTTKPTKLKDGYHLRCGSPAIYYGQRWEAACMDVWIPSARSSKGEKIWSTIMISILIIGALIIAYVCMQKALRKRNQRTNRREYNENREELLRIRDLNERMLQEESAPTAVVAHETCLPTYEDALRMPKLERPAKSMGDLTTADRSRRHLCRSQTQPDGDKSCEDDDLQLDTHQRFRSVEMLSNRDKERTAQYGPHRRTGHIEYSQSGSRRFSIEDSRFPAAHLKRQNLQSAEQIGNFQSYENSPYTKRKPKIAEIPPFKRMTMLTNSVEFLTDPEYEDSNSKPGSPFAKRKPKSPPINMEVSAQVYNLEKTLAPAVEDYFSASQKANSSSTIASDSIELVEPELSSLTDENRSNASTTDAELDLERGKRKKRTNSVSRRVSGNFSASAAAAEGNSSSSDEEPNIQAHKPMRETIF